MSDLEVKRSEPFAAISTDCDFESDATNGPGTKTTWLDDPDKSMPSIPSWIGSKLALISLPSPSTALQLLTLQEY